MPDLQQITTEFKKIQDQITLGLENLDGQKKFKEDIWHRKEGGGGRTRIIENGNLIEKGGVNFSHVFGKLPDVLKSETRNANHFDATGISIVLHAKNPFVPIIHMNVRYFEMDNGSYWFGGGIDVSPIYAFEKDIIWFHQELKKICDLFDENYYPRFKKNCDEYFYIPHRKEMRGIGGLFFDHLKPNGKQDKSQNFDFVKKIALAFVPIYSHLANQYRTKTYDENNLKWQAIRRGRYVEFNLVYDRGTHFGLKSNGRIESILMSLPPQANWIYDYHPEKNSLETQTLNLLQAKEWLF